MVFVFQFEEDDPAVPGAHPADGQLAEDLDPRGQRSGQQEVVRECDFNPLLILSIHVPSLARVLGPCFLALT